MVRESWGGSQEKCGGGGFFPSPREEEGGQEGVMGRALPNRTATRPPGLNYSTRKVGLETPLGQHLARHAKPNRA